MKHIIKNLAWTVTVTVAVFCGYNVVTALFDYKKSDDRYKEIENKAFTFSEEVAQSKDISRGFTPGKAPQVDFEYFHKKNKDVVGWIYIPAEDISYPILHGKTNEEYLNHTYRHEYDVCGSIVLESSEKSDMSEKNIIIYGHNTRNITMFSKTKEFLDPKKELNPYVWIILPNETRCYRIFSSYICDKYSDSYTTSFSSNEDFLQWCNKMRKQDVGDHDDTKFREDDSVITLSTCKDFGTDYRVVNQAVMVYRNKDGKDTDFHTFLGDG